MILCASLWQIPPWARHASAWHATKQNGCPSWLYLILCFLRVLRLPSPQFQLFSMSAFQRFPPAVTLSPLSFQVSSSALPPCLPVHNSPPHLNDGPVAQLMYCNSRQQRLVLCIMHKVFSPNQIGILRILLQRKRNEKANQKKDVDMQGVEPALLRAARTARRIAKATKTSLVIYQNGKIVTRNIR